MKYATALALLPAHGSLVYFVISFPLRRLPTVCEAETQCLCLTNYFMLLFLEGNSNLILLGLCPKSENEWNKWKNNFSEMKEGCHVMKKERNGKVPTPRHKVIHNPIPTSLFLGAKVLVS